MVYIDVLEAYCYLIPHCLQLAEIGDLLGLHLCASLHYHCLGVLVDVVKLSLQMPSKS